MYKFSRNFEKNLLKNTGIVLTEDNAAYIKSVCKETEPYRKIDNKGRHSAYFTFRLEEKLVTLVCDEQKRLIVTCVIETHNRPQYWTK
jgi:hypothetical protein